MNIIKRIAERIAERRARRLFPLCKRDFWYCGEIYWYKQELKKAGKPWRMSEIELPCEAFLINPYMDAGGKQPQTGDIIPCMKLDGWIAYYLVTDRYRPFGDGDYAMWDDGWHINLHLHHCERADTSGGES